MGLRKIASPSGFAAALALIFALSGCGLGQSPKGDGGTIRDPVVAARVNGRPIYIEDVRAYAVQVGLLEEGEDLDANSDAFFYALEDLIELRLFALEAEARGLDRDSEVRRRLEAARERVLANSVYEGLQERASDPDAVERLYRENTAELGQGQEIHLRHIQFDTREAAEAAKRRLDAGEQFERLAFELSTDRATAADGGDLRFRAVTDFAPGVREATERTSVGDVAGPIQIDSTWHLFKVEDRRERGVPSLETLRPQIVQWLLFEETQRLRDRLERDARIERLREAEPLPEAGPGSSQPDAAEEDTPSAPTYRPRQREAPPFPFPMGPGGVFGGQNQPSQNQPEQTQPPAQTDPEPEPEPPPPATDEGGGEDEAAEASASG